MILPPQTPEPSAPTATQAEDPPCCSICCQPYDSGEESEIPFKLPCGHEFGGICISNWLHVKGRRNGCPLCRQQFFEKTRVPDEDEDGDGDEDEDDVEDDDEDEDEEDENDTNWFQFPVLEDVDNQEFAEDEGSFFIRSASPFFSRDYEDWKSEEEIFARVADYTQEQRDRLFACIDAFWKDQGIVAGDNLDCYIPDLHARIWVFIREEEPELEEVSGGDVERNGDAETES